MAKLPIAVRLKLKNKWIIYIMYFLPFMKDILFDLAFDMEIIYG